MSSTLASQLSATAEGIRKNVAAPMVSMINQSIAGLKATFDNNSMIQFGVSLPAFKLPNALGNEVTSDSLLAKGPVLITFYRGDWCPYCNLALRSLQLHLDEFHAKGVTIASPELPNTSLSTTEKNELKFEVLSDVSNKLARQLRIVWDQPKSLESVLEAFKVDLKENNGDDSMALPIPTTLLVDAKGVVRNIHIDPHYRQRLETTTALAWVDALLLKLGSKKSLKGIEPNPIRTDNLQEIPSWNLTRYRCAMGPVEELQKTNNTMNPSARPVEFRVLEHQDEDQPDVSRYGIVNYMCFSRN
ncbi:hypothetical protein MKX08_007503 [Trichoderma sp. CBMAI-0020]|nr:hypothetical protein MKX08_007503 [Trichoderma sp. CBMAI-0020]